MPTQIQVSLKEKSVIAYRVEDVEPILENNKLLRSLPQKSDWGRHVATIPNIISMKWLQEEWNRGNDVRFLSPEWDELVQRKLEDPDWKYLRTDR